MKFTRPQIRVLCALTLAYTCGYICRTHISMLLPSLMEAFSLTQAQGGLIATLFAVVYACGQLVVGLVVDRLLERQEIVIKPLGAYLGDLKGISGATIMGDGSVILILDPHEIYVMSTSKASNSLGNEPPKGVSRASSSESSGCEEFTI